METVQVLLSTYNGAQYIREQLDSLLNQTYGDIQILIRDDGSSDDTRSILKQYTEQYPAQISWIEGTNIGVIPSFWTLMQHADSKAAYYCFCDQDDVWMPEKVARAVAQLHRMEQPTGSHHLQQKERLPAMIFTATQLTDADLNPTTVWPANLQRDVSFYNALFQNVAVGATVTINRQALFLLRESELNITRILMHDWWMYLTISCFGKVYFDPQPSIYYRQHGNNAVGGESTISQKIKKKWKSFRKHQNQQMLVEQAREFKRIYGKQMTDPQMIQQLDAFIAPRHHLLDRVRYLRQCRLYRQSAAEQNLFRFLILIGYL
ncbi:glycosyltransferase family 2 protein [Paenibacillus bovis]|uniref:Glycosyl transferase family 2 n=1 Tax=Paenibacillus bovis TaxID=1616788 RepID=A0A172ZLA4_9BACL|nr:glycosyltransferase family 2 protein [Paenibacillus bovis]ANF98431.1 glycosyl transferase family 2 [Paenibacillus bovis]